MKKGVLLLFGTGLLFLASCEPSENMQAAQAVCDCYDQQMERWDELFEIDYETNAEEYDRLNEADSEATQKCIDDWKVKYPNIDKSDVDFRLSLQALNDDAYEFAVDYGISE